MEQQFKFYQDEIVSYDLNSLIGIGRIKGVSAIFPEGGAIYIIEQISGNLPTKDYPFTAFVCP